MAGAFEVFYRRHHVYVLGVLARRTGDVEVAVDLMSEVFAAAYLGRRSFDPSRGPARGWLTGIAHHKVVDHYRRGRAEMSARERLGMEPRVPTDRMLEEAEALIAATQIIEGLPPMERDAVWARIVEERGYDDMARDADRTAATMRKRVSDGLARLVARGRT